MAVQSLENILQTIALDAYVPAEAVTKLEVFAHNYGEDFAQQYDTVNVPVIEAGEAKELADNQANGMYVSDGTMSCVPVTLDKQVYSSIDIKLQTFNKYAASTHVNTAKGQATKVARAMMQIIAKGVETECKSDTQTAPTDYASLVAFKKTISKYAKPILVLNAADYDALITDEKLMNLAALSGKEALATGTVNDLLGVRLLRADITTAGFVCDAGAIAFATALTATDSNASQPIIDEKSGCTMLVKYIDNGNPPTVTALVEILFGYKIINKKRVIGFNAA